MRTLRPRCIGAEVTRRWLWPQPAREGPRPPPGAPACGWLAGSRPSQPPPRAPLGAAAAAGSCRRRRCRQAAGTCSRVHMRGEQGRGEAKAAVSGGTTCTPWPLAACGRPNVRQPSHSLGPGVCRHELSRIMLLPRLLVTLTCSRWLQMCVVAGRRARASGGHARGAGAKQAERQRRPARAPAPRPCPSACASRGSGLAPR